MEPSVPEPFVALMRRYCIDYTARHDLSVCDDIMVPGYTLHMGVHHLAGRDEAYKPAAAAQFRQFPGLCLTVNEIICSGDRLALRFTEHGASARHDGARAAWAGVGLYRWDGQRLLENYVEQDYFGRRRQLRSEEHTSELQSQSNLVCRLLLEKKTNTHTISQERLLCTTPQTWCYIHSVLAPGCGISSTTTLPAASTFALTPATDDRSLSHRDE